MKKLFNKHDVINAVTAARLARELTEEQAKTILDKRKLMFGLDAAALGATPVIIKLTTDKIDDDYAKNVIYATGGLLWAYQLATAAKSFSLMRIAKKAIRFKGLENEINELLSEVPDEEKEGPVNV